MKDFFKLLNSKNDVFSKNNPDFQKKLEGVENAKTFEDLLAINGSEKTKKRLDQLGISPEDPIGRERLIGNDDLKDISFFKKALKLSKTVCRIICTKKGEEKENYGTGFLVGKELLLTNNHVIKNKKEAKNAIAEFEYEKDVDNKLQKSYTFKINPEAFFLTNAKLDYTLVGIESNSNNDPKKELAEYGWNQLSLTGDRILDVERVNIIQHPDGKRKKIAFRKNKLVEIKESKIHYTADTEEGSSGSLVANDQWEIIALHRSSVSKKDKKGFTLLTNGGYYKTEADLPYVIWLANEGVLIDAILKDIDRKKVGPKQRQAKADFLENYLREVDDMDYKLPV